MTDMCMYGWDVQWEEQTGKSYRALSYLEREQANNEIKAMKAGN